MSETGVKSDPAFCLGPTIKKINSVVFLWLKIDFHESFQAIIKYYGLGKKIIDLPRGQITPRRLKTKYILLFLLTTSLSWPRTHEGLFELTQRHFKGPQPHLVHCCRNSRDTRTRLGVALYAWRSQDTVSWRKPWFCVCSSTPWVQFLHNFPIDFLQGAYLL